MRVRGDLVFDEVLRMAWQRVHCALWTAFGQCDQVNHVGHQCDAVCDFVSAFVVLPEDRDIYFGVHVGEVVMHVELAFEELCLFSDNTFDLLNGRRPLRQVLCSLCLIFGRHLPAVHPNKITTVGEEGHKDAVHSTREVSIEGLDPAAGAHQDELTILHSPLQVHLHDLSRQGPGWHRDSSLLHDPCALLDEVVFPYQSVPLPHAEPPCYANLQKEREMVIWLLNKKGLNSYISNEKCCNRNTMTTEGKQRYGSTKSLREGNESFIKKTTLCLVLNI